MNNDLDAASKALRTIDRNKLDDDEKAHYGDLRDMIKDGRREAFSHAFEADVQAGGAAKGKGAAAAEQAAKLGIPAIVVHGAWYANPEMVGQWGKLGRSEGCFALPETALLEVIGRLGPGRLLFADRL